MSEHMKYGMDMAEFYKLVSAGLPPELSAQIARGIDMPEPTKIAGPVADDPLEARIVALEVVVVQMQMHLMTINEVFRTRWNIDIEKGGW